MADKPWTTVWPASLDTTTQMPVVVATTDKAMASQMNTAGLAIRNLQAEVGTNPGDSPAGSIRARLTALEGSSTPTLDQAHDAGNEIIVSGSQSGLVVKDAAGWDGDELIKVDNSNGGAQYDDQAGIYAYILPNNGSLLEGYNRVASIMADASGSQLGAGKKVYAFRATVSSSGGTNATSEQIAYVAIHSKLIPASPGTRVAFDAAADPYGSDGVWDAALRAASGSVWLENGQIRLKEISADPSNVADYGFLYTKDISGTTELFYRDSAGNVRQLTPLSGSSPLTTKGDIYTYDTGDARLAVGTNGQVLTADSAEATGVKWADAASGSPLTTKGDLHSYDTDDARLAVGTNGQVLTADSAESTGIKWADAASGSPLTTKGDIHTYDTDDARLPVGTDGQVLVADSAEATGVKWAAAASGSSPLTTKGDLHTYDTDDARLPVGTNGQVLVADSTESTGVKWDDIDIAAGDSRGDLILLSDGQPTSNINISTSDVQVIPESGGGLSFNTLNTGRYGVRVGFQCAASSSAATASFYLVFDEGETYEQTITPGNTWRARAVSGAYTNIFFEWDVYLDEGAHTAKMYGSAVTGTTFQVIGSSTTTNTAPFIILEAITTQPATVTMTKWDYLPVNTPDDVDDAEAVYQFDGSSESLKDRSGNGHDLTFDTGSAAYTAIEGLVGLLLDGDDLVAPLSSALQITGDITLEALVSWKNNTTSTYGFIVHCHGDAETEVSNLLYGITNHSNSAKWFHEYSAGSNEIVSFDTRPVDDHLCLVTMVRSGTTLKLFIDGNLVSTKTLSNAATGGTTSQLHVGQDIEDTTLCALRVTADAMEDEEVAAAFKQVFGPMSPSTAGLRIEKFDAAGGAEDFELERTPSRNPAMPSGRNILAVTVNGVESRYAATLVNSSDYKFVSPNLVSMTGLTEDDEVEIRYAVTDSGSTIGTTVDTKPAIPDSHDDEFEGTSQSDLKSIWTWEGAGAPSAGSEDWGLSNGSIWWDVRADDNIVGNWATNMHVLSQPVPSGNWELTTRLKITLTDFAAYGHIGLWFAKDLIGSMASDGSERYIFDIQYNSNDIKFYATVMDDWASGNLLDIYLKVAYNSTSGTFTHTYSYDGVIFVDGQVTNTYTPSWTVGRFGLFAWALSTSSSQRLQFSVPWFRVTT